MENKMPWFLHMFTQKKKKKNCHGSKTSETHRFDSCICHLSLLPQIPKFGFVVLIFSPSFLLMLLIL